MEAWLALWNEWGIVFEVSITCWGHLCETGIRSEARSLPAVWAAMEEAGPRWDIACR